MSLDRRGARYLGVALAVSFVVAGIWVASERLPPVARGLAIIVIGLVVAAVVAVVSRRGSTRSH
jgi:hypothetical protein